MFKPASEEVKEEKKVADKPEIKVDALFKESKSKDKPSEETKPGNFLKIKRNNPSPAD